MAYSGLDEACMAWKQDLAKLKQTLGPEVPVPKARPKPAPRPEASRSLESEDEVFLSAMGLQARAPQPAPAAEPVAGAVTEAPATGPATAKAPGETPGGSAPLAPAPAPESFQDALKELKGLKPMARGPLPKAARPAPTRPTPPPAPAAPPPPPAPAQAPLPAAESASSAPKEAAGPGPGLAPVRFQLAAGMAIEVDSLLDLRGHSRADALERLKDRLEDGRLLGWRSLQVTLGPEAALHEGLLELLAKGELPLVGRYAQAPVPMGGTQAWLLYYASVPPRPCEESRP